MASKWVSVQRRAPAMHAVSAGAVFLASCVLLLMLWGCGSYPPVFYLISPNKGFMLGTEPGVLIGELAPQSKTSITARNYCFGTGEVVNPAVATEVGDATLTSTGGVTGTSDKTSVSSPQQGGKAITDTLTVNSDGTFSTLENPGVISGAVISDYQLILVDQQGSSYPTILVIDTIPEA